MYFRSRSESYWTAVVGEFDITKADPEEQVMKVNRIITHPKVSICTFSFCPKLQMLYLYLFKSQTQNHDTYSNVVL